MYTLNYYSIKKICLKIMQEDILNDLKQLIESAKTQYVKQLLESELTKVENRKNAAAKATENAVNKTSMKTTAIVKNIDRYGKYNLNGVNLLYMVYSQSVDDFSTYQITYCKYRMWLKIIVAMQMPYSYIIYL